MSHLSSRSLQAHQQRMDEVTVPLERFAEGVSFSVEIVVDGREYKVGIDVGPLGPRVAPHH